MMYYTFTVKGTDYKLRLGAKACVDLEKKLKKNPVQVLADIGESGQVPELENFLVIMQASMSQYNHSINMDKMYEIYDEYIDEGHTMYDLVAVIMDVFKVSGLIPENEDNKEKN